MKRLAEGGPYLTFFGPETADRRMPRDAHAPALRHRRHARHRPRHRARARARRLEPRALRRARRSRRRAGARRAARTRRRRSTTSPATSRSRRSRRGSSTALRDALRRAQRAGQQRRPRAARCAPTCSTRTRGELRGAAAHQPAGPVLPHAGDRARAGRRAGAPIPSFRAAIVFITSVSAEMASANRGEYCVSKAGLSMAARLFAVRLADARHPGLRSAAGHHRHRHDRRGARSLRSPHRRRPGARTALGHARGRRPRRRRAAARRRSRTRPARHQRRRRPVHSAAVGRTAPIFRLKAESTTHPGLPSA